MNLYLVQHGQSKPEEEDPERRLTDKGTGEVQKVAKFLSSLKLEINVVWHSGKPRARQTAELLVEAIGASDRIEQHAGLGPNDKVAATKKALEQSSGDVMIVGHLPFLGKLVALLVTGNDENEIVQFQFGSVVCLERRDGGKWKVAWMIKPALLHDRP
jgi:phosphohistidine phosphatase